MQLCRAAELSKENVKTITGPMVDEVHAVQEVQYRRNTNETVDCKFSVKTNKEANRNAQHLGKSLQSVAIRSTSQLSKKS